MSQTPPAEMPPLIPRDVLFGNPLKSNPQLSPDAAWLAYLAPVDGVLNVWVGPAVGSDPASGEGFTAVTRDTDRGVRNYFWSQDSRRVLYLQDAGGNEEWHLYAVDLGETGAPAGEARDLTPFEGVQAQVIGSHKEHPDELMIALNRDDARLFDAYHLRLSTGEMVKVAANPGNVVGWLVDPDFQVRGAGAALPDGSEQLLMREPSSGADAPWRVVKTWAEEDALSSRAAGFTRDSSQLYLIDSTSADTGRLVLADAGTGATVRVLAEDPRYDMGRAVLHPDTYVLQAATVLREKVEWRFFDEAFQADFERLRQVRGGEISLVGRDRADAVWLVAFSSDTASSAYYYYDRATREARHLFSSRPELDAYTLAPMQPISVEARDGLMLEGYLTTPPGVPPRRLPTVLLVHGGPWSRDTWGLAPQAQWLANRGYAVVQINYRGSTGYGKAFVNAGNKEWGGRMHDDLIDAVNWAEARGVADPERVAIYGGSYGGYAALVGATFTPDVFACAVDIVGPSSLATLIQTIPPYWQTLKQTFTRRVGDPDTEAEFLESRSPLFKVNQIKIPMLIAQGANDPRVKQAESDQIVAAMRENGIECDYMLFPDEGHGFAKPENRVKFQAEAERFLAAHLGGRMEE